MSIDYGSKPARRFIKAINKAYKAVDAAHAFLSIIDDLLIQNGDHPVLDSNKKHVISEFVAIYKHLQEIKITMAEDKHGRIRHGG